MARATAVNPIGTSMSCWTPWNIVASTLIVASAIMPPNPRSACPLTLVLCSGVADSSSPRITTTCPRDSSGLPPSGR